ncbi:hypothetical protein [uncultured Nostoc sp.]|uniref:hypothetical protein n=1 Tax=uncultured Nostoc sp. TaxID=340711 RepID=UPI0035CC91A9
MKKLQRVMVALRESERWFRAIFNQTFGFIRLIEPIEILMKGNRAIRCLVNHGNQPVHN